MKKIFTLLIFATLLILQVQAQDMAYPADTTDQRDKEYANPSVSGTPRSAFLIARYNRTFNFDFNSRGHHLPVGEKDATIKFDKVAEIKGYIPVWNRPYFKAVLGIAYEREEFDFKDDAGTNTDFAYYRNLQDKGLKSLSTQLALLKPLNERNFVIFRIKGQLNGDYTSDELNFNDYLRVTADAVYGWKVNKDFAWGVGAQVGYNFGRQSIFPAIMINRTFNEHWGLEAVLPANATLRYRLSDATYFYTGAKLDGYSYVIKVDKPPFRSEQAFNNLKTIELRHNNVKLRLRWEQEIYDFIWFSLEGGYRYNIAFDAFEEGSKRRTKFIKTDVGNAPYAQAELYLVVPHRFLKR